MGGAVAPRPFFHTQNKSMILTKDDIIKAIENGDIVIDPLNLDKIQVNSVDLHLSRYIITLEGKHEDYMDNPYGIIDVRFPPDLTYKEIGADGLILWPNRVYLGSTIERTITNKHVPIMHGKSSIGRLGLSVHDAGFGDIGFKGHWTLELSVKQPVRIYAGIPICQLSFHEPKSLPTTNYMELETSSYTDAWNDPKPQPTKLWQKLRGTDPQP